MGARNPTCALRRTDTCPHSPLAGPAGPLSRFQRAAATARGRHSPRSREGRSSGGGPEGVQDAARLQRAPVRCRRGLFCSRGRSRPEAPCSCAALVSLFSRSSPGRKNQPERLRTGGSGPSAQLIEPSLRGGARAHSTRTQRGGIDRAAASCLPRARAWLTCSRGPVGGLLGAAQPAGQQRQEPGQQERAADEERQLLLHVPGPRWCSLSLGLAACRSRCRRSVGARAHWWTAERGASRRDWRESGC